MLYFLTTFLKQHLKYFIRFYSQNQIKYKNAIVKKELFVILHKEKYNRVFYLNHYSSK